MHKLVFFISLITCLLLMLSVEMKAAAGNNMNDTILTKKSDVKSVYSKKHTIRIKKYLKRRLPPVQLKKEPAVKEQYMKDSFVPYA